MLMYCSCTVSTGLYRFEHPCRASTLVAFAGRERVGTLKRGSICAFETTSPRFTCKARLFFLSAVLKTLRSAEGR